jgi:DNA-binding HxlR family transcriptional regulator
MNIPLLVKITARAWALPILAQLHRGVPGRAAPLLAAVGAGRNAFVQSLEHLQQIGLVERNPGHGHPLRPEYRLTPAGIEAARMADQIEKAAEKTPQNPLLRRSWTVPILALSRRPLYFSDYKLALPKITDRALSQSLKTLQSQDWIAREIPPSLHPPRPLYQAVNAGAGICRAVGLELS